MDPRLLAAIVLRGHGGVEIVCGVSRLTGDLIPARSRFCTLEPVFTAFDLEGHYAYLRAHVLNTIFKAIENGQLKENEYIRGITFARKIAELQCADRSVQTQNHGMRNPTEAPLSRKPLNLPGSMRPREEPKRFEIQEGRISWRRVVSALKRCGVAFDFRTGSHPKLRLNGKTTRFLNPHDTDTRKNRIELYRVLQELDIPEETFARHF